MLHTRVIAIVAAAAFLGAAGTAAADPAPGADGAEVFNFGQCVSQDLVAPSDRDFGPVIFLFTPAGTVFNVPPGLQEGPAANPSGQIGCVVIPGP
jgi:hypothetical protein